MNEEFIFNYSYSSWDSINQECDAPGEHTEDIYSTNIGFVLFLMLQPVIYFFGLNVYHQITNLFIKDDAEPTKEEEPKKTPTKYEDKYLEQYSNLETRVLSQDDLDRLKSTMLMERTPLGNLMMHYDPSRESFVYYSDNTIPYRFLEVASRCYVVQNNCKSIHVNMQDELSEAEKRMTEKKEKEKEKEKEENFKKEDSASVKKSVYAKLKNYNTASTRAPNDLKQKPAQQNSNRSGPTNSKQNIEADPNIIVKEKANRYSYEGKFANFSFLKKVDKKILDKRLQISFADFMKMSNSSK